LNNKYNLFLNR